MKTKKGQVVDVVDGDALANASGTLLDAAGEVQAEPKVVQAVLRAWRARLVADQAAQDYKEAAEAVKALLKAPATVRVRGVCSAEYVATQRVTIRHVDTLRAILGERYDDLVETRVTSEPTEMLLALAGDGDEPLAPAIRAALRFADGERLTLRPDKPEAC